MPLNQIERENYAKIMDLFKLDPKVPLTHETLRKLVYRRQISAPQRHTKSVKSLMKDHSCEKEISQNQSYVSKCELCETSAN